MALDEKETKCKIIKNNDIKLEPPIEQTNSSEDTPATDDDDNDDNDDNNNQLDFAFLEQCLELKEIC